ncbi:formyl transferase [Wolffia australiana]
MESARMGFASGPRSASENPIRRANLFRLKAQGTDFVPVVSGFLSSKVELRLPKVRAKWKILECGSSFLLKEIENQKEKKRLAVFVSGGGSNFRSIYEATVKRSVNGDVVLLVTDKPGCGGAQFARDNGIPVSIFPKTKSSLEGLSPSELVTTLREFGVDFILLAGYLKLVPGELVQAYPKSILNIHPALLPAFGGKGFYGLRVHAAVIASGARYSGATIHFVDEHYDEGRILAQRIVPVLADDTPESLAKRVLTEEHKLYPEAIEALCEGRITWRDDGVPLIRNRDNPDEFT